MLDRSDEELLNPAMRAGTVAEPIMYVNSS